MGDERATKEGLWVRLQHNCTTNEQLWKERGLSTDHVGAVRCACCGKLEKLLFWTHLGGEGDSLQLQCTYCGEYQIGFNSSTGAVTHPASPAEQGLWLLRPWMAPRMALASGLIVVGAIAAMWWSVQAIQPFLPGIDRTAGEGYSTPRDSRSPLRSQDSRPAERAPQQAAPGPVSAPTRPSGVGLRTDPLTRSGPSQTTQRPAVAVERPAGEPRVASSGAARGAPAETRYLTVIIFTAPGDRRDEIAEIVGPELLRAGASLPAGLQQLVYLEEIDYTRVILNSMRPEWIAELAARPDWERGSVTQQPRR